MLRTPISDRFVIGSLALLVACLVGFAAPASAADAKKASVLTDAELSALAEHFVVVKFHFKRSEEATNSDEYDWTGEDDVNSKYESFVEFKQPMVLIGVMIAPDRALTIDTILDDECLDRIEVCDFAGGSSPARREAVLRQAPGMVIAIEQPDALKATKVTFADLSLPVAPKAKLTELEINQFAGEYLVSASPALRGVSIRGADRSTPAILSAAGSLRAQMEAMGGFMPTMSMTMPGRIANSLTLIVNEDKQPVGVGLAPRLPNTSGKAPLWVGKELLKAKRVTFAKLKSNRTKLEKELDNAILEVEMTFRQNTEDGGGGMYGGYYGGYGMDDEAPGETFYYGFPIAKDRLLIPEKISRENAKIIDKITIDVGGKEVEASFQGAFKDLGAFVVKTKEAVLPYSPDAFSNETFPLVEPLITIRGKRQFGGKQLKTNYSRALNMDRGYKDILEPIPMSGAANGAWFVDLSGSVRGIVLGQRKDDEDKERFRDGDSYGYYGGVEFIRLYTPRELKGHFAAPDKRFDRTIVWLPKKEEKRKMWLGIEFARLGEEQAKVMKIEKATKDGGIGLLVSGVYPNSPASRLGLEVGDILLKLHEEGEKKPIELSPPERYDFSFDFGEYDIPREMESMGYGMPRMRPWPQRTNFITQLLEVIGEGKTINLTYLNAEREEVTIPFVVEQAPPDFESSEKYKDKAFGLTVRELTYEARFAMMLPDDVQAVVVADVEEGEAASVAHIGVYDLIVQIDGEPIDSIESFKRIAKMAAAARNAGAELTLRFTLQQLDRTRFADVTLE